jgi:uncharacterized damage-inducible protein DinB
VSQVPHLRRLFRYDDWANREAARALAGAGHPSERARKLLAHIAGTEWVWRSRIRGEPQSVAVWPEWDIGESTRQIASLRDAWERDLGELDDSKLERAVVYVNTAGTKFSSALGDILMHVVMHSGYHRGQIAAEMRAAGDEPAYTDFIHAARQGKIE